MSQDAACTHTKKDDNGQRLCYCCRLPIHPNESGLRYMGFGVAHRSARCIELLWMEIDRLRAVENQAEKWRGIFKLTEECGEMLQVIGKLGPYPTAPHPDGKGDLKLRLEEEIADVKAAIAYVESENGLDTKAIMKRSAAKLERFIGWVLTGIREPKPHG